MDYSLRGVMRMQSILRVRCETVLIVSIGCMGRASWALCENRGQNLILSVRALISCVYDWCDVWQDWHGYQNVVGKWPKSI